MSAVDTHLTSGWEPGLSPSDTITRRFLLHLAELNDTLAVAAGGHTLRTPEFAAADTLRPAAYFNSIVLLQPLHPDTASDVLDRIEQFIGGGTGMVDLWSLWPTPDLRPRGWTLEGHPPLLIRPPAAQAGLPHPGPVECRPVTDVAGLEAWERVAIDGYPFPELASAPPGILASPALLEDPRLRFWVSEHGGRPAGIGTLFAEDDIASFALGVTRPEVRGRGHWASHATTRIAAQPDVWMTGVFSDMSRPLAERIGFIPVTRFALWTRPRAG